MGVNGKSVISSLDLKSPRGIAITGMLGAVVFVATRWLQIPLPSSWGYIHTGDAAIFMTALTFGPWAGAVAAGAGSALADWLSPFSVYAPWTLLIKSTMGFVAGAGAGGGRVLAAVSVLCACAVMLGGYFIADWSISGSRVAGTANLPLNAVQAVFGAFVGVPLAQGIRRRLFNGSERSYANERL